DAVWRETGIAEKFPSGGPPVRWRTPIGAGYAGPAVAHGKGYVRDKGVPRRRPKSQHPLRARHDSRHGTRSLPERGRRQDSLAALIRLSLWVELSRRPSVER